MRVYSLGAQQIDRTVPPDRPLYPLEPRGLGSGCVEALSGYACRLAKLHSVLPRMFVVWVRRLYGTPVTTQGPAANRGLSALNGFHQGARSFVEGLTYGRATQLGARMTLLPWTEFLDARLHGVLEKNVRFCWKCVQGDLVTYGEPYLRLLWAFSAVTACPIHRQSLITDCPNCGDVLSLSPWLPEPFFCMNCKRFVHEEPHRMYTRPAADSAVWVAGQFHELMRATHGRGEAIPPGRFVEACRYISVKFGSGSPNKVERLLRWPHNSFRKHIERGIKPSLEHFVHLFTALGLSPVDLLLTRNAELELAMANAQLVPARRRRHRVPAAQLKTLEKRLSDIVGGKSPPMSRRMIAKECGVPPTTAKAHFEKLIIEASKRWAEHRRQVVQQRNEARRNRVREAARGLLEVGVFPSQRKLRATGLVSATDLTRPAVRRVVSAIAAEYGWGPLGGMRDR